MADIVLKDRDGNDVEYEGVNAVQLAKADGTTQTFLAGEAQEKTVGADFSGGDMTILPDGGKLLTAVTVPKPAGLVPGNIAEGVDIAGIIGELAAGGSGNVKVAGGTKTTAGTYTHNFGVIPDVIAVIFPMFSSTAGNLVCISFSRAFAEKYRPWTQGSTLYGGAYISSSVKTTSLYTTFHEERTGGIATPIYAVNETTMTFGSFNGSAYQSYWLAIGGLT